MSNGLQALQGLYTGFGIASLADEESKLLETKNFYQIAGLQTAELAIALAHIELFITIPSSVQWLIRATPLIVLVGAIATKKTLPPNQEKSPTCEVSPS